MWAWVRLASFLLVSSCVACKDPPQPQPAVSATSAASAPEQRVPLAERDVSGEVAFELVSTTDGAALVWGSPTGARTRLLVALLDGSGTPQGEPVSVSLPGDAQSDRIVEVAAVSVGARVGVAWIAANAETAIAWGALGDVSTRAFTPGMGLGEVTLADRARRGHLAAAASDRAELLVLRRGLDEPCSQRPDQRCATFAFRELLSTGAETRGLPLSVPAPCPHAVAGFSVVADRWHYALCSLENGRPQTTLFNVQRTPFYADAKSIHDGCAPLGSTVVKSDAVTVADCDTGRRATLSAGLPRPLRSLDLSRAAVACERGRPVLRVPGDEALELVLDLPRDGLAPLLPARIASATARAAWTGSALLVAAWMRKKVVLSRWQCRGAELTRTD